MKKVCLVTGAKKGIGLAVSQKLLENGYKVIMADCEEIELNNPNALAVKADKQRKRIY